MNSYAFIFDMDGVIVDSNPYHKIALREFCKKHGFNLSEEHLREKIYGRTNKDWIPNVFGDIDKKTLQVYADEKEALFRKIYEKDIRPLNGLVEFLEKVTLQNIPLAIATSASRANVDFTLIKTATQKYFNTILDESYVNKGKPDPEIYLKTAAELKLPPSRCVVFEDSLSGVESGRKAGCKVVGVTTTHSAGELADTDLVINDFRNLDPQALLKQLF